MGLSPPLLPTRSGTGPISDKRRCPGTRASATEVRSGKPEGQDREIGNPSTRPWVGSRILRSQREQWIQKGEQGQRVEAKVRS